MNYKKYFKRETGREKQNLTLKDYIQLRNAYCFFCICVKNGKRDIIVDDGEGPDDLREAEKTFEGYVEKKWPVRYYNYKTGQHIYFNGINKIPIKLQQPKVPVDFNALVETIKSIGKEYDGNQLPQKYFPFIHKLLNDGVLGTGYKDMKATTFREKMIEQGFSPEGRASHSKYMPHGNYPNWEYENGRFKKDTTAKIEEAKKFAQHFIEAYKTIRHQSSGQ